MTDSRDPFDPRVLIALLSPHGVNPLHIPGGYMAITASMVAIALSTVSREASMFGKVKYARMDDELERLSNYVLQIIARRPHRKIWPRTASTRQARRVLEIALREATHPPSCDTCHGDKFKMVGDLKVTCGGCGGTGKWFYSDEKRAECLGMLEQDFNGNWRRLHTKVIQLTSEWDDDLYDCMDALLKHHKAAG